MNEIISYALATLRHITWTALPADPSKGYAGRNAGERYGFGTRAPGVMIGIDGVPIEGNMSFKVNGKKIDQGGIDATWWCADSFKEADYELYKEMGALTCYIETTGDVLNPVQRRVISVEDFEKIDNPIMSDTLILPQQPQVPVQAQTI